MIWLLFWMRLSSCSLTIGLWPQLHHSRIETNHFCVSMFCYHPRFRIFVCSFCLLMFLCLHMSYSLLLLFLVGFHSCFVFSYIFPHVILIIYIFVFVFGSWFGMFLQFPIVLYLFACTIVVTFEIVSIEFLFKWNEFFLEKKKKNFKISLRIKIIKQKQKQPQI